jgi:maleylacetate reductase
MTPVRDFVFAGITTRVIFGRGTLAKARAEVERLGHGKALVLSTPQQEAQARALCPQLGDICAGVFAGAVMHTPVEVTEKAVQIGGSGGRDCSGGPRGRLHHRARQGNRLCARTCCRS